MCAAAEAPPAPSISATQVVPAPNLSATCISTERCEAAFAFANTAVRRVQSGSLTYGTAVRLSSNAAGDGIFATATHVVAGNGRMLECHIDNQPVTLIASVPRYDIVFITGAFGIHKHAQGVLVYRLSKLQKVLILQSHCLCFLDCFSCPHEF